MVMTAEKVMEQTGAACLCLIHPILRNNAYRQEISPLLAVVPHVQNAEIATLIIGNSWRERLAGFTLAMATQPEGLVKQILQSLQNPRGIAIVPACALLSILAEKNLFQTEAIHSNNFDRTVFDGELGWAIDKIMFHAGLRTDDVLGHGSNYGQIFEDHREVYRWIFERKSLE
jgi:hypothetical protein